MRRFKPVVAVLVCLSSACVFVPSVMWRRAEENRARLDRVVVGQSMAAVHTIMKKDPERRETRLRFDGKRVEMWSYVTDYARKLDTTLIFVDDRLEEIRTTPWRESD